ncbi:acyltransferase family protein [Candidatus Symbiothrix dinenymphae]|nr:acyltransferase family protein [Candidatus Symbiothrix dinenymphae]
MRKLYAFLFKMTGWKVNLQVPVPAKCVICIAPHTSNWDFFIGRAYFLSVGGGLRVLVKKGWFFFPLGLLLRAFGGVPVDRTNTNTLTDQLVHEFATHSQYRLGITPEGTRKKTNRWKTGFYYIALNAKVPISLAYLDYATKTLGIMENFIPTGNKAQDIAYIKSLYKNIQGKYPERFAL